MMRLSGADGKHGSRRVRGGSGRRGLGRGGEIWVAASKYSPAVTRGKAVNRVRRAAIAGAAALALAVPVVTWASAAPTGCSGNGDSVGCGARPRVVVADIDTGINPYHSFFHVKKPSVTPAVLAEFGIDAARVITLT